MARFKFPSFTSDTSSIGSQHPDVEQPPYVAENTQTNQPQPGPSTAPADRDGYKGKKTMKGKDKDAGRVRSGATPLSKEEIAARIARRERILQKMHSTVFVGNISSTTTEAMLHTHFASCGPIYQIEIRCSRGAVITTKGTPSTYYASIEFSAPRCERPALQLNGSVLDNCTLVVCVSPIDLPEATYIRNKRHAARLERAGLRFPRRPIPQEPTFILPNVPAASSASAQTFSRLSSSKTLGQTLDSARKEKGSTERKHKIMGYSFVQTIC